LSEVCQQTEWMLGVSRLLVHECADRHSKLEIVAVGTGTIAPLAMLTTFGAELRMKAVVDEGIRMRAGDHEHRAAETTVAAARTAAGDELLTAERETTAAAAPSFYVNVDFVYEHRVIRRFGDSAIAIEDCNRSIAIHQITQSPDYPIPIRRE
jgi:hypothetical protein